MLGCTLYTVADWSFDVPSPTELTHVTWVGTSNGVDLYVDGSLAGHIDAAIPLSRYVIGAGSFEEATSEIADGMVGLIDELAIYNRALTAEEIAQHYQAMLDTVQGVTIDSRGVLENDSDADGDALTAILVTPTENGQLELHANGGFKYVPNADFHGTDTFTYIASDGVLQSNPATVTITVAPVQDRPVAVDDGPYEVTRDTPLSVPATAGVLANDRDADGDPLSATLITPPASGSVEFNADGSFVYTPRPGMVGHDRFIYRVSDGTEDSEAALVLIRVLSAEGGSSLAQDDYYTVSEDQALVVDTTPWLSVQEIPVQVRSLAYDPVGDRLFATIPPGAGPRGGTVTEINPYTGELGESLSLPGSLGRVVISDNGETMHVVVDDGRSVQLVDLASMTLGPKITFGGNIVAGNMIGIPGRPQAIVITPWDPSIHQPWSARIYENGQLLPEHGGGTLLAVDEAGQHVYGYENWVTSFYFWVHEVDERGMHVVETYPWGSMLSGFIDSIQYAQGHLFVSGHSGVVVDIAQQANVALFQGGWIYQVVSSENTLYTFDDQTQHFYAYDLGTFEQRASVQIPGVGLVRHELTRFGNDGLAIYNDNELVLVRSDTIFGVERRGVLRNDDVPSDAALAVQLVEDVEHGTLDLQPDGTFHYQPAQDYFGSDRFSYAFLDGVGNSHVAEVNINVTSVNDPPVAADDHYVLPDTGPLLVEAPDGVLSNDDDPADGDTLTAVLVREPRFGDLTLQADGSFSYQPNATFVLSDDFTYQASDGKGNSDTRTVTIRLNVPTIDVGSFILQANTPNQRIDIWVSGGQVVSGVDFYAQIGDGGPERATLGLPPGQDGPSITSWN